jgi:hypothetical protein
LYIGAKEEHTSSEKGLHFRTDSEKIEVYLTDIFSSFSGSRIQISMALVRFDRGFRLISKKG